MEQCLNSLEAKDRHQLLYVFIALVIFRTKCLAQTFCFNCRAFPYDVSFTLPVELFRPDSSLSSTLHL